MQPSGHRAWERLTLAPSEFNNNKLFPVCQIVWGDRRELNPAPSASQAAIQIPLDHGHHGGQYVQLLSPESNRLLRQRPNYVMDSTGPASYSVAIHMGFEPTISALTGQRLHQADSWTIKWRIGDSNPSPFRCQRNALPDELIPHGIGMHHTGVQCASYTLMRILDCASRCLFG